MERWVVKLIALGVLMCTAGFTIALMLVLSKKKTVILQKIHNSNTMSLLTCFSSGIYIGTVFLHLLPEVRRMLSSHLVPSLVSYPASEFLLIVSFLLFLLLHKFCDQLPLNGASASSTCSAICLGTTRHGQTNADDDDCAEIKINTKDKDQLMVEGKDGVEHYGSTTAEKTSALENNRHEILSEASCPRNAELSEHVSSLARLILLMLTLCMHSLLVGMTLGLQWRASHVWALLFAICLHKVITATVFMLQLLPVPDCSIKHVYIKLWLIVYALASSVGLVVTAVLVELSSESVRHTVTNAVLMAVCAGAFGFISFYQLVDKDKQRLSAGQLMLVGAGIGIMALIRLAYS